MTASTATPEPRADAPQTERPHANPDIPHATPERAIPEAARRALMEAAARREAQGEQADMPIEHGGPRGAEPTRFGDWEKKGLAIDF